MIFRDVIAVYSENHIRPISTPCGGNAGLLDVKARGTYIYHSALK
jgi:hypothetical protein